ncbi:monovalent cation:H+ antiporter-2, CPA2 family [Solimonas aquatica]|uniref:Monovalent cation:H+ antiporter-2, CPA2 family n=1 Tax=Solimonas aquatica TaxID=489703 RepID=A0A1H9ANC5_9GAMM|nr:YbaL family putative K(+) efflux transporter [Solimonas aquatica]SEP78055.1 monovalent cation:H+ antiporter-2, CPA2 family [Solimonas aquatica]
MHHPTPLIATIVAGLVLAFIFGALAQRLRLPPLVGYLLAGVLIGPNTPGFVADQSLAAELAELGVILLMFGVGLHFSLKELLAVRRIALPGALVQIAVATLLGAGLALLLGWPLGGGLVFGLALSVASTVVLLRALQDRRLLDSERGRIAVGWLIVEDLAMVLALVLIPVLADALGGGELRWAGIAGALALTLGKVAAFVAVMMLVGRRVIPRLLDWVAATGSRELFNLSVLACALGVALGAAYLFDVSFALGAFFAGMILAESPLAHRAAEESLPLREAFAVLFFVSVGMLFDPAIVLRAPLQLLATLAIILIGKSIAAFYIVRAFGYAQTTALTIAASLAQIGEFSFILATLGRSLELFLAQAQDLILAGAIASILFNPLAFAIAERRGRRPLASPSPEALLAGTRLSQHAVVVGYGRVGSRIAAGLRAGGRPYLVIEDRDKPAAQAREDGAELLLGNAAQAQVLAAANLAQARCLFVAIPQAFEAGQVVKQARQANAGLLIVARAHSDAELLHLQQCGASLTVMSEQEIAGAMLGSGREVLGLA